MKKLLMFLVRVSTLMMIFVLGFNVGCAILKDKTPDYSLEPYVDRFIKTMDLEPEDVEEFIVRFRSSKPGTRILGSCSPVLKRIDIDPNFWYNSRISERARISVIFHELSHCLCKQYLHDDTLKKDKCPVSLMHSELHGNKCLVKYWDEYMEDLKDRCR